MPIEIQAIGGYKEIGRNCTAIKVDDDIVLLDIGLHMENYVHFTEDEDIKNITAKNLIKVNAVPDFSAMEDWKHIVRAIIPSHAHLDHVGAIPFLANQFKCPIIATPYTIEVLKALKQYEHIEFSNKLIKLNPNSSMKLTDNITVELINVTHSTPQTAIVALHTKYGTILYANDYKLDETPHLGPKTNLARLKQLKGKIILLITECLYIELDQKMPSEQTARHMLKEIMLNTPLDKKALIITTFSSHIERLQSIIEFSKKLNRKIIFLGRSLNRYITAAENINLVNFSKDIGTILYGRRAEKALRRISKEKENYIIVMTGHQGEPRAMLSRIANEEYKFDLKTGDYVVFSCRTIPTPTTMANRKVLESRLKEKGARIFTDIHGSGHSARHDLKEFIELIKPEHLIPTHGEPHMLEEFAKLAHQMGYKKDKVHVLGNGDRISIE